MLIFAQFLLPPQVPDLYPADDQTSDDTAGADDLGDIGPGAEVEFRHRYTAPSSYWRWVLRQ